MKFEPKSKVTLLYANANEDNITFKNELHQLEKEYSQFIYVNFISGQKRIGKDDLAAYTDASFYMCGPDSLNDAMTAHLKDLKVKPANINIEHYADGYVPWFGLV